MFLQFLNIVWNKPGNEVQCCLDRSPCPDPEHQVYINQYSVENTGTRTRREGGLLADPGLRVSMTIRWKPMYWTPSERVFRGENRKYKNQEGGGLLADPGLRISMTLKWKPMFWTPKWKVTPWGIQEVQDQEGGGLLADPGLRVSMTLRWKPMFWTSREY